LAKGGGILHRADAIAMRDEIAAEQIANLAMIVDDSDVGYWFHRRFHSARSAADRPPFRLDRTVSKSLRRPHCDKL
jgi:hypothetical protein